MKVSLKLTPIGVVHSPYTDPADIHPLRSRFSRGTIEVYPEFAKGLADIDGFSHIYVLWWFHLSKGPQLLVSPLMRPHPKRGVFATRHPCRPNPLGLTVVRLLKRDKNILYVKGVDMVDGTPVLDIKPYTRRDRKSHLSLGWVDEVERREA